MGDGTWHWLLKIPGVGDFYSKLILWGFSGPRGRGNEIFVGGSIPNSLGCGCLMIIIYEEKRTSGERHIWQNCGEWGHSRKSSDSHTTLVQGDPRHSGFFFQLLDDHYLQRKDSTSKDTFDRIVGECESIKKIFRFSHTTLFNTGLPKSIWSFVMVCILFKKNYNSQYS